MESGFESGLRVVGEWVESGWRVGCELVESHPLGRVRVVVNSPSVVVVDRCLRL